MVAALGVVLLAVVIVAATFFWLGRRDGAVNGPPELIEAPPGPYKVKPPNPGGLDVAGESETAFETSAGEDSDAQLDLSKVPEAPVAKPPSPKPERFCRSETRAQRNRRPSRSLRPWCARQRHPARRLREPGAGRARLDRAVRALSVDRQHEQD